jgi:hypothetical protein
MLNAETYLLKLKRSLIKEVRERYNYSPGGKKAVQEYNYNIKRIVVAPTIGDVFRVARDLNIGLESTLRAAIGIIIDIDHADLQEVPESW